MNIPSRSFSNRALLGVVSLALLCSAGLPPPSAQAEQVVVNFETSEGFVAGEFAAGHAGWRGTSMGSAADLSVTHQEAYRGEQSFLANNARGAYAFAQSPNLYSAGFSSLTFYLKNPTAEFSEADQPIARWEVVFADSAEETGSRIVLHLRYSSSKTFHIHAGSSSEALAETGNRNVLGGSNLKLDQWSEVGLHFNFNEKLLVITVNGSKLSRSLALNPEKVTSATRVSGIRFGTPEQESSGTTFYDFVRGFPAKD